MSYDPEVQGALCHICPLRGRYTPVPPSGPPAGGAVLCIVGERPGQQEIEEGIPFVGRSGEYVLRDPETSVLGRLGVHPRVVHVNNAMLCLSPTKDYKDYITRLNSKYRAKKDAAKRRGEPAPPKPVYPHEACRPRLLRELAGARVIFAMGKWAARSLLGAPDIKSIRGFPVRARVTPEGVHVRAWGMGGHERIVDRGFPGAR